MSDMSVGYAGRYRLDERIAAGSVGEVWRGADLALNRPVAVKLLRAEFAQNPETLARFRAEAQHAGSLSHPAIAQVYDYVDAHPPYLVMELVDGRSLAGLLAQGPLDPARTLDVVAQVADGLAAAHAAGLVHRDIKPANLLVGHDGKVKITDFGIAHAAGSAPLTRIGNVLGTPAYLAPERVAGAAATPSADIYSLGVVAYECLAGVPPYRGAPLEVASAHRNREMPPLPASVPAVVAGFVAELTAKDAARRPASARQVARRARQLKDDLAGPAMTAAGYQDEPALATMGYADHHTLTDLQIVGSPPDEVRPRRRWSGLTIAAVVAGTAVAAGLIGWVGGSLAGTTHPTSPAARHSAPASPTTLTVDVNASSLIGQPVSQVQSELAQLGLQVSVAWQTGDQQYSQQTSDQQYGQQSGIVTAVRPSGLVTAGSTVYLTAMPSPSDNGHGGDGNGGGHGGGNGGN